MGEVRKLELVEVGEEYHFDPDEILEAAKGQPFNRLVVLGQMEDGTIWVSGNANLGETLVAIEQAKHALLFGEE